MSAVALPLTWQDRNQAHLVAALARVRALLERHAGRQEGDEREEPSEPDHPFDDWPEPMPPPALAVLVAAFGLSPFERDILLACAGIELDARFGPACAAALGDAARPFPTFGLALAALPGAHWSALTPDAPLRRWRLVEPGAGSALTAAPLRIDERILHFLAGVSHLDERLAALVEPAAAEELVPSHAALAEQVAAVWSGAGAGGPPLVQLCGPEAADRRAVAAAAAATLGWWLAVLPAELTPTNPSDLDALARLWEREAALGGAALLVECDELDAADGPRVGAVRRLVGRIRGPVVLSDREPRRPGIRPLLSLEVPPPTAAEQRAVWHQALGGSADGRLDGLAAQFRLGATAIRAAAAASKGAGRGPEEVGRRAWAACRARARPRLDGLARRIEPAAGWDDLVLPPAQMRVLREIAAHVRHRETVYERWGFAVRGARGLGISALFTGASGTGKTMTAEVLAGELGLDLYSIDLSAVVSKYIGETEKNLRRVFDAAEQGGAILQFDEADALFGKRSEVKDSHDRYANIEVSYLLQRMEAYRGLAILTTNLKGALDPAFLRRIRFVVQFPFPDAPQRAEIWRRIFPPATPTEGLDVWKLAKLNVPGGNIRNIALNAAFLAADASEPVRMRHLCEAARSEYSKLERSLTEAEIGGWV
jgi:hypothetical protein